MEIPTPQAAGQGISSKKLAGRAKTQIEPLHTCGLVDVSSYFVLKRLFLSAQEPFSTMADWTIVMYRHHGMIMDRRIMRRWLVRWLVIVLDLQEERWEAQQLEVDID